MMPLSNRDFIPKEENDARLDSVRLGFSSPMQSLNSFIYRIRISKDAFRI